MKKYLLLAGVFTVCATTSAQADGWYYEDNGYSQPTYQEQGYYRAEPRYVRQNQGDYRPAAPRYRQISPAEARNYRERQYTRSSSANTYTTSEDTNQIRPYIGVDGIYTNADMDTIAEDYGIADTYKSLAVAAGLKFNKNFGAEIFYQQSGEESEYFLPRMDITTKFNAYGIDLQGYLPISQEVELMASLGIAQYNYEVEISGYGISEKEDDDTLGIRLGVGAQYNITNHIALRGMVRYTNLDEDYIKNLIEFSLGLRYMF